MNRFFDFSPGQVRFLAVLSATALVMGGYLFVHSYAYPPDNSPALQVFIGDNEQVFTGIFVLDPNTAPVDSLELLPGIGPVLADRIVAYRQHRQFEREVDITEIKGIGPKMYERLRPYLRIRRR